MRFSYSNINTFGQCPYKWYLQYKEHLKTLPQTNADNALYLGLALHKGVEDWSVQAGIDEYKSHFPIITDEHINWIMQLEYQIPRLLQFLPPDGEHEIEIKTDNFVGYVDYVVDDTIYDFKFSNNVDSYIKSPQLSIYKYYLEKVRPDLKINHLKYVFVPKVNIRQKHKAKPPESIIEFRQRLSDHLEATEIKAVEVDYNTDSVQQFQECCQLLNEYKGDFPKNPTKLCNWCQFQQYCESDGKIDWMIT